MLKYFIDGDLNIQNVPTDLLYIQQLDSLIEKDLIPPSASPSATPISVYAVPVKGGIAAESVLLGGRAEGGAVFDIIQDVVGLQAENILVD